jgi:hypothetical protein
MFTTLRSLHTFKIIDAFGDKRAFEKKTDFICAGAEI